MPPPLRSALMLLLLMPAVQAPAQDNNDGPSLEIYAFAMTDFGFDETRLSRKRLQTAVLVQAQFQWFDSVT
jgi:hypothetical protein